MLTLDKSCHTGGFSPRLNQAHLPIEHSRILAGGDRYLDLPIFTP
jgi:hypothetical protein